MRSTSEPRPFVVVSGIPASGKSTLANQLALRINLPLIDKDDLLIGLFESAPCETQEERTELSRRSDDLFRDQASKSSGAILVSFWHQEGMHSKSGTPLNWVFELSTTLAAIHCECPRKIALSRFTRRTRHPGHQDSRRTTGELEKQFKELSSLGPLPFPNQITVDTTVEVDLDSLVVSVKAAPARRITIP